MVPFVIIIIIIIVITHNEHHMKRRCNRLHCLASIFLPAALCLWAKKYYLKKIIIRQKFILRT